MRKAGKGYEQICRWGSVSICHITNLIIILFVCFVLCCWFLLFYTEVHTIKCTNRSVQLDGFWHNGYSWFLSSLGSTVNPVSSTSKTHVDGWILKLDFHSCAERGPQTPPSGSQDRLARLPFSTHPPECYKNLCMVLNSLLKTLPFFQSPFGRETLLTNAKNIGPGQWLQPPHTPTPGTQGSPRPQSLKHCSQDFTQSVRSQWP